MARILRNGRSYTFGALFCSGSYHAPQERVKYLAQCALRRGYQLLALDLEWFGKDHRATEDYLLGAAVEGVVLCNLQSDTKAYPVATLEKFLIERGFPVVALSSFTHTRMESIYPDLGDGFYRMTQHHLAQGSRELELLLAFRDADLKQAGEGIRTRIEGFSRAIVDAGGEVVTDPHNVDLLGLPAQPRRKTPGIVGRVRYPIWPEGIKDVFELGSRMTEELIQKGGKLPDSLVCSNDHIAAGALSACIRNRIDIPGEMLISGADDAPFSRFCGVPLTTIAQPAEALAEWSLNRIVELIENPEERSIVQVKTLPCEIVPRLSTQRELSENPA